MMSYAELKLCKGLNRSEVRQEAEEEEEEEEEELGEEKREEEGRSRGRCWERSGVIIGERSDERGDDLFLRSRARKIITPNKNGRKIKESINGLIDLAKVRARHT